MLRTSVILVASFGLLAGCATSSANSSNSNPPDGDAGKVTYDIGQPSDGGAAADGAGDGASDGGGDGGGGGSAPKVKGRDSTTTRGANVQPKVAKRVSPNKPPKPEEPPQRQGKVNPHGLLGEAFTIPAGTESLPDFADFDAPRGVFIVTHLAGAATTGLPKGLAAPVALRFTGSLNVVAEDEYKLCLTSVDGSQLYLEETLIVDNDGIKQSPSESCELVTLPAGEYMLEVRSFHVTGPVQLELSWAKGKDGTPTVVTTRDLYKPEDADARVKASKTK
ncbi:MAG TPA: PA14 domain-containing protein [Nannocystis sp.]